MNAKTGNTIDVHIRWLIRRDMPEVLDIENNSFEFPWPEEDFVRVLKQRNAIGLAAEHNDSILGFVIYELHKNQLHILNFAVNPGLLRRGIGRQLMARMIGKLSQSKRNRIVFSIRETNLKGQNFLKAMGFKAVSVIREYWSSEWGTSDDAYVMQYRLNSGKPTEPSNRLFKGD